MRGGKKSPERALLYARSATGDQQAIAAQLARMRKHATSRSYTVAGETIEQPTSGNRLDRPGLAEVFRHALQEPPTFDVLVVTDADRLGRNLGVLFAIIDCMTTRGIRIDTTDHGESGWPTFEDLTHDLRVRTTRNRKRRVCRRRS